jgi:hypothetical protein
LFGSTCLVLSIPYIVEVSEYTGVASTVPRSIGNQVEQGILPSISKLLMIFTILLNSNKLALSN